ncbi:MAG: hypothetical protein KGJ98_14295 [Chloroflexota bacterium]|nr:hypothetical protein [Chloroflexota bacterium]MDE3103387.1 hypothetical protein [Chloroflexota bacterium]
MERTGTEGGVRAALLALSLVLAACGGAASGGPAPTATATPATTPAPTAHVVMVTTADDKRTVTAHVGDRVQIALGEQYAWTLEAPDGVVLARHLPENYMLVRGTQAIWDAKSAGTSTIHATGTVPCPSGKACIQIAVPFTATVDVLP